MVDEEFKSLLEADLYLIDRKDPTEPERQLYLKEVDFCCPLCGKIIRHSKQKKPTKFYEIAHIFPNRPTKEQYEVLRGLERLGNNSEAFENKIALCKDCHTNQDFHTTKEDYLKLLKIKKRCLEKTELNEATLSLGLETQIADVINKLANITEEEFGTLNYSPVKLTNKFLPTEILLKNSVMSDVTNYYPYIRDLFKEIEGKNNFRFQVLSTQIKACFLKMEGISSNKTEIFNQIAKWIGYKTGSKSEQANKIIVSFFVQNCEVFNEIT